MQGMSGSPVYIDGKLVGAVAMAFPFAKDPIAGIRPIEDMVRASAMARLHPAARRPSPWPIAIHPRLSQARRPWTGESRMIDIATPISFGGFTQATLDAFAPQLRALGLEPRQGIHRRRKIETGMGNPADLNPAP